VANETNETVVDEVFRLFQVAGANAYFGERVSQKEHALQTAHLAERAGAPEVLIAAALLHDIGHLLHGQPENIADDDVDAFHEKIGGDWLERNFPHEVSEAVRLHVAAKRYLCWFNPAYLADLSDASLKSLELQGGPFTDQEATNFEDNPMFRDAVALRKWDDAAKVEHLKVPKLEHYREILEHVALSREATPGPGFGGT
jgi:[1-hydroxy-2-(trimethylamino)ethyl]phosphonate dioxygenase